MSTDEYQVITLLREGDENAFHILYKKYAKQLFCFINRSVRDSDDSNDLLQTVFVKIWETRSCVDPEGSFSGYLYTIARNLMCNYYKKKIIVQAYQAFASSGEKEENNTVFSSLVYKELSEKINIEINNLPKKRRQIFVMSRKLNMSYKEIAEQLGISENTVDTQIRKALQYLREKREEF
ncbi:MAG: RNA polymerase sigma-W factor [uncultured bacterium]|nr:MAG: RNA polymerase sigma-W factor [uncultured bacterium]HBY01058.1 hypothetical protein [Rikenellaceae bacterium]